MLITLIIINRLYKVNLVAISSDPKLGDSEMSSTVMVNTGPSVQPTVDSAQVTDGDEDFRAMSDDNELKLRVIRVDEASIHLDWTEYQEAAGIIYYRVVWSSAAQPAVSYFYSIVFKFNKNNYLFIYCRKFITESF